MTDTVQIGKRFVPLEQIAVVEPFEFTTPSPMRTEKPFKARIVLLDRNSVLIEEPVEAFAEKHGFRMLREDEVATNPAIHFHVEAFERTEGFEPTKPYQSRLVWRDFDGNPQSKLLVTEPGNVLAIAVRGELEPLQEAEAPKPIRRIRRRSRAPAGQSGRAMPSA